MPENEDEFDEDYLDNDFGQAASHSVTVSRKSAAYNKFKRSQQAAQDEEVTKDQNLKKRTRQFDFPG